MKPGLSEQEGRAILKQHFTSVGYHIVEDYHFVEDDVDVTLDGFDPKARVGYEFLTVEGGDDQDFTGREIGRLMSRTNRREVQILLIDGAGRPDRDMLDYLARNFLREVSSGESTRPG